MLRVGVIGCGFIAQKHVRVLLEENDISLVAVADTVPENMEKLVRQCRQAHRKIPRQFLDYQTLLECPEVDAVVVAVPSGLHATITKQALSRGKHVVVEKPMALSITDAREMCELAEQADCLLVVCHQKRFYPHLRKIHEVIKNGLLGKIVFSEVSLIYNRNEEYYRSAPWRGTRAMDGGVLVNQGIHNIDLLLWFVGCATEVCGYLSRQLHPIETEDTAAAILRHSSGALTTISATVCAHPNAACERISIYGTHGRIELEGKRLENIAYWDVQGAQPPEFEDVNPYFYLYQDLIRAVSTETRPLVDGKQGYQTLRTILSVYESFAKQTPIHLTENEVGFVGQQNVFPGESYV